MKAGKAITFVLVFAGGLAAMVGAALHTSDGRSVQRWLEFYIWKFIAGEAHGGHRVDINDASIYYETYGAGPPVLVLHGGLGSIEGMSYQIRALATSHFVIAPDSRGQGRSTDSEAPLSYSLMSDDMLKLLDYLHVDRVDVVGWSDGAIIGLDLAMHHPNRIRRLVAISANYDVESPRESPASVAKIPPAPVRYRLLAPDPAHWPKLFRKIVTMWQTQPHYTLNDLGRIKAPTLIMAGEFDAIKRQHTDQLARAIPDSREVIIEGATHAVPVEKPEIVNANVLNFLNEQN
jgi:pimeloyl-ACP methyl ester carboxylesterase